MSSNSKKRQEREIFLEFAKVAGIPLDHDSVTSPDVPKPDILCNVQGKARYFELTQLADQKIANDLGAIDTAAKQRKPLLDIKGHSYSDGQIVVAAVKNKDKKRYETDGCRFDLLIYCDGQMHATVHHALVADDLRELRRRYAHKWDGIWFYDRNSGIVDCP